MRWLFTGRHSLLVVFRVVFVFADLRRQLSAARLNAFALLVDRWCLSGSCSLRLHLPQLPLQLIVLAEQLRLAFLFELLA